MIKTLVILIAASALGAAAARADEAAADRERAAAGQTFANAVCAQCHAIEAGAKSSPDVKAPPFASMVKSQKLTAAAIEGWLTSSHTFMPDFAVPADKRADLIAYIESLALKP